MVEKLRKRNQYCFQALASLDSVSVLKPAGAFYVFPAVEGLEDSFAFALALLRRCKVAVAPGVAFGRRRRRIFPHLHGPRFFPSWSRPWSGSAASSSEATGNRDSAAQSTRPTSSAMSATAAPGSDTGAVGLRGAILAASCFVGSRIRSVRQRPDSKR